MHIRTILLSLFVFAAASVSFGQTTQVASAVHDLHTIDSQILGERRTILVRVPAAYRQGDTRFPVVYMLDAHPPQNAMMVGLIEQQAWGGTMPEMIIVGLQNTNRGRDLTPTKGDRGFGGGADKFLDYIRQEVMPLVEKNYRTHPYRIFAGHSLGGLMVVHAMVSKPDMFEGYVAASPVLHWDNDFVIKRAGEAFKQRGDWKKTLFVGLGDEPNYVAGYEKFRALLKRDEPKGLKYGFEQYKTENHGSVVLPAYYAGLRKVFEGWEPPRSGTFADIESHYKGLTERYGYPIHVPEAQMNQFGYQLLNANKIDEALAIFKKNTELYPNSANVYDSFAEALEKDGQLKKAKENYEKAFKLAETRGETQLATTAKGNVERLEAKIK